MTKKKYKVLVVEDDKAQNDALCKIVNKVEGCEALSAFDGLEALKVLDENERGFGFMENDIDLILLDYQMPNMTGEDFIQCLRTEEHKKTRSRYIPVVIVSAYNDARRWSLAKNSVLGMASGYIVKPYDMDYVMDIIRRIVINKDAETLREILRNQETSWYKQYKVDMERRAKEEIRAENSPANQTILGLERRLKRSKLAYLKAKEAYEDRVKKIGSELESNYEDRIMSDPNIKIDED